MKTEPDLIQEGLWWSQGLVRVAGVDEAGRGPWAGPVVAGAVVLPPDPAVARALAGVRDSKQLSPHQRERLFGVIKSLAVSWAAGVVSCQEIDRLGILPATRLAMRQAIDGLNALGGAPQALLVDAVRLPAIPLPQRSLIHGDALSLSIAAASIIAKVTRDQLMREMDGQYPGYGFARHKGYGTAQHAQALNELGPCPIHRRSFAPVARVCAQGEGS